MVAIGHWPLADLVNVVAQGLVLPDATPGTVMQLLDLELSEHIGTCLVVGFYPLRSGRQMGRSQQASERNGPGAGRRPSSNLRATMKITSSS